MTNKVIKRKNDMKAIIRTRCGLGPSVLPNIYGDIVRSHLEFNIIVVNMTTKTSWTNYIEYNTKFQELLYVE